MLSASQMRPRGPRGPWNCRGEEHKGVQLLGDLIPKTGFLWPKGGAGHSRRPGEEARIHGLEIEAVCVRGWGAGVQGERKAG